MEIIKLKKIKIIIAVAIATVGLTALIVFAAGTGKAAYTPTTNLKWYESGIPGGVTVSPIFGDIAKTEHLSFVRFPAGTKVPMHIHNTDYVGVVVSGNMRHPVKGQIETNILLPPGSHWSIPANLEHETECLPGVECIALMYQKNHFDYKLTGDKGSK